MSWLRRTVTSGKDTRRTSRGSDDSPELLEVWGPADEPRETWTVVPAAAAAPVDAGTGAFTCIRLNCPEQGRPTAEPRCPVCGHSTGLMREYRWPRPDLV